MPGKTLAELRLLRQRSGRPSAAKLRDAAKRQGINLTDKEVQAVSQVFQPTPRSEGKVTSPELNARWQADLMDYIQGEESRKERWLPPCADLY